MTNRLALRAATLTALTVALSGAAAEGAQATPAGPGPGNSANVHQCQRDGWRSLVTSSGQPFTSQADCISHAANGGVLAPLPTASLVLNFGPCFGFGQPDCLQASATGSGLQAGAEVRICNVYQCAPFTTV